MNSITQHYSFTNLPDSGRQLGHNKIQKRSDSITKNIRNDLDDVLMYAIMHERLSVYEADENDFYTRADLENIGFQAIHIQVESAPSVERPSNLQIGWADPKEVRSNLIAMRPQFLELILAHPDAIGFLLPLLNSACNNGGTQATSIFFTAFVSVMQMKNDDSYLELLRNFREDLDHIYSPNSAKQGFFIARDWEIMHSRLTFPGDEEYDESTPIDGNIVWHTDYTHDKVAMIFANVEGVLMRSLVNCE